MSSPVDPGMQATGSPTQPPSATTLPPDTPSSTPPSTSLPPTTPPTSSVPPPPTSTEPPPPPTSSSVPPTSSTPPQTPTTFSTSTLPPPTTPATSSTTELPGTTTQFTSLTPTSTDVIATTATSTVGPSTTTTTTTSASSTPTPISPSGNGNGGGLDQKAKVAIGVVVPIAAIALLAVLGLFWWKKRKARQEAEEERRKEVEDYSYNPNADPTIPVVGGAGDGAYEMREDGGSGYRGWGTTVAGSTGRKASTTLSGGVANGAFSDGTAPRNGVTHSGDAYVDGQSPEGEILGAMGPSAANNRGDVKRGPSNASSSYSAAGRSDGSDGGMYGGATNYYDQYAQNPYGEAGYGQGNQAIIRDNPARRNAQIESTTHYPQQSAGIAQNF